VSEREIRERGDSERETLRQSEWLEGRKKNRLRKTERSDREKGTTRS
jgi:hypothetical protein